MFDYPSEYLEQIQGSYGVTPALIGHRLNLSSDTTVGPENTITVIASLTFKTNIRTYGPFGVTGDTTFESDVGKIVGLFGKTGFCLDCIGVCMARGVLLRGNYTPFLLIRVSKLNSGIQSWGSSHFETCKFEKKHNALKLPI